MWKRRWILPAVPRKDVAPPAIPQPAHTNAQGDSQQTCSPMVGVGPSRQNKPSDDQIAGKAEAHGPDIHDERPLTALFAISGLWLSAAFGHRLSSDIRATVVYTAVDAAPR